MIKKRLLEMKTRKALRLDDGLVTVVDIYEVDNSLYGDGMGAAYECDPLTQTGRKSCVAGWGKLDGLAIEYENIAGVTILVPMN